MSANPQQDQGVLNRVRGSVQWTNFPSLNVTAAFLGPDGIRIALEGGASTELPTMTGIVQSPEPYMMGSITMHLLKSQALAAAYKAQMEDTALLGPATIQPDAQTLPPYDFLNCAIINVRELAFNGRDAEWVVTCRGFYIINNALWNF